MKHKQQTWPTQLNDGGWRSVPSKAPGFCNYLRIRDSVRQTVERPQNQVTWELKLNGIRVARGDLSDMLARAEAVTVGVPKVAPGQPFPFYTR